MNENDVAKIVVDAAFKVHTTLGPGLLESAYDLALAHELTKRNLKFARQVPVHVNYDGVDLGEAFKPDYVVEDLIIVELKSVEKLSPVFKKQILTYIRLSKKKLGLLINFGEPLIKDGIHRVVSGL